MDRWEKFDETSLPDKKAFYSKFYLKDITDKYYTHAQNVFEELGFKNLGEYHDLYVQRDTLLFADIFETLRNKCVQLMMLRWHQIILSDLEKILSIYNKVILIDDQIIYENLQHENLQHDINRKAAKISALGSNKLISTNILLVKKYYHLIKNK